jgi:AGCS family alanine or glycine:cation symporter
MTYAEWFYYLSDTLLVIPFILVLIGSIILSFKIRFAQIRMIPQMISILLQSFFRRRQASEGNTIQPHKALLTAMSTTIGIGNISGPIIAMGLGGPGALAGFILATVFGCATTFVEVSLALAYRKKLSDGTIQGGPMQYLQDGLHPFLGKLYAYAGFILLVAWSSAQSNTLAVVLEPYGIARSLTGLFLAITMIFVLVGGIKRLGELNEKLVPLMFIVYCTAAFWILLANADKIGGAISLIFNSFFTWQSAVGATAGLGFQQALRHGLARALQANEAGVGTSTFPHSMAETKDPVRQGILAMVSVYSNGFICLLTGLMVLVSGVWGDPNVTPDISMLSKIMEVHFGFLGPALLAVCAFLFAYGTILGNAYNGSQCFLYVTKNRWLYFYYFMAAVSVFLGTLFGVKFVWTMIDFFIIPVAVPHMIGIVILALKKDKTTIETRNFEFQPQKVEARS